MNDPRSGNDFDYDVNSGEQLYDFYIKSWTPGGLIVNGGSVVIGKRSDPTFSRTLYQNILDPYDYEESQSTTEQVPGPPTLAITFEIWKRVAGVETKLASMNAGGGQVATRLSYEAGVLKLWMHNETTDTVLLQVADSSLQTGDLVGMIASLQLSATSVTTALLCTGWEASGGDEPVFLAVDSYGRVFPVQNLRSQPDIGALANDGVVFFTEDGGIINLNGFDDSRPRRPDHERHFRRNVLPVRLPDGMRSRLRRDMRTRLPVRLPDELPGRGMPDRLSDGLRSGLPRDVRTRLPVGLPVELPGRRLPIRL